MTFEEFGLDPRILAGVKAAGYTTPTPIQQQAIPVVLDGKDILGLAQTGTGKTAAFALPILQHLTKGTLRKVRALIVAPTRELAEQIHQSFVDYGGKTKVRSVPIYGGVGKAAQINELRRGVEVVVACPGRLLDHIGEGNIDLSGIEILVLDEADRMCDMGFLPDIRRILTHLPKQRQTLFFSATMPEDIRQLSQDILKDPVSVQIGHIAPAQTVAHALYPVTDGLKTKLLFAMLERTPTGRVIVFTRTKRRARFLAADLQAKKYRVAALQGNMAQNRRQEAINGFKEGKYDILVATDIAARGIDVTEISHVINFDMPDTTDAYTHRIGRTGRAEQSGDAFTFATLDDLEMVRDIEKVLGKKIERRRLEGFEYSGFSPENFGGSSVGSASTRNNGQNGHRPAQSQPSRANGQRNGNQSNGYQSNGNRSNDNRSNGAPAATSQRQQPRPARQERPVQSERTAMQERSSRPNESRASVNSRTGNQGQSTRSAANRPSMTQTESAYRPKERPAERSARPAPRAVEPSRSESSESSNSPRRRIWRKRSVA